MDIEYIVVFALTRTIKSVVMGAIEVLLLGTGTSGAALVSGVAAATSFVILIDGHPSILVGCGAGVLRAVYHYLGAVPNTIIILSNSLEQTAEIPLLIETEVVEKGRHLALFGASAAAVTMCNALTRLYFPSLSSERVAFEQLQGRESGQQTLLRTSSFSSSSSCPSMSSTMLLDTENLYQPYFGKLDEANICGSIVIYFRDRPVVSFTGPTGALTPETLLWLSQSPTVVCWVGPVNVYETRDRAPFSSILRWFASHHQTTSLKKSSGGDLNTSTVILGSMFITDSNPSPSPSHCILCGWGTATDEPVAMTMPSYATLAPQGSLMPVLVGDFVQSGVPNAIMQSKILRSSSPLSSPPSMLPSPVQQQLLPHLQPPTSHNRPSNLSPTRSSPGSEGAVARDSSTSAPNIVAPHTTLRPSLSSVNVSISTAAPYNYRAGGQEVAQPPPPEPTKRISPIEDKGYSTPTSNIPPSSQMPVTRVYSTPTSAGPVSSFGRQNTNPSMTSSAVVTASSANTQPSRTSFVDTRRVKVFNNDNKGHEGKVFIMKNFRQLSKFTEAVAQQLNVKPLSSLVFADGRKVSSLDELPPDCHLIAVRRGGAPFDVRDMPRGVSQ